MCTRRACFHPSEYPEFYDGVAGFVSYSPSDLLQRGVTCAPTHELSCRIDPKGYLYKCLDLCGQTEHAYARLGNRDFSKPECEELFLGRSPTEEDECRAARPYLPLCFGGCPLAWIEKVIHYYAPAKFLIEGAVERMHSGQ